MNKLYLLILLNLGFLICRAQVADRYPYIQSPDQSSVIIAWNNATSGIGSVHWGTSSGSLTSVFTETTSTQTHAISLTGLQPNTKYYYQASSGAFQSGIEYFYTAKPDSLRRLDFVVYGDCGFNSKQQDSISAHMATQPADFGLVVGDVDQITGNNYDVNYFSHYTSMTKHTCHFTAIGNHDTLTNQTNYTNQFYLPHNNAANTELYYSFTWGHAKFIALDGNMDYSAGSAQYVWLENQLKCNGSEWTFVFFHQPPWSNAWDVSYYIPIQYWYQYQGNADMRTTLVPLFEKYKVDAVLNGHAHDYQRGSYNGVHYFIAGGGGTSTPDTHTNSSSPNIQFELDVNNFMKFSINNDSVNYYAFGLDGSAIDSGSFTKTYVPVADTVMHLQISASTLGLTVSLNASQANAGNYSWTFGNGATLADTSASITYTYTDTGSYNVQLITEENCGVDTSFITVNLKGDTVNSILNAGGNDFGISVFPNPFKNTTTLQITSIVNRDYVAVIFNTGGRQIRTVKGNTAEKMEIGGDELSAGYYFLTVTIEQVTTTLKVLVQ